MGTAISVRQALVLPFQSCISPRLHLSHRQLRINSLLQQDERQQFHSFHYRIRGAPNIGYNRQIPARNRILQG